MSHYLQSFGPLDPSQYGFTRATCSRLRTMAQKTELLGSIGKAFQLFREFKDVKFLRRYRKDLDRELATQESNRLLGGVHCILHRSRWVVETVIYLKTVTLLVHKLGLYIHISVLYIHI